MGSETDSLDESFLDFKELNDLEYDIPTVAPPSLESVLWDMESEEGSDNASLNSLQSFTQKSNSMLYHGLLQGISSQIASAGKRVGAGSPTVITNGLKLLAVGTSHGYILAFDWEQKLCWCCHDTQTTDQGAISALAFNLDSTRLLIGYERGYISMVDTSSGDVIRRLPDVHAPQSAVLHLRFTVLNNLALCGDSSGCVFTLTFIRRLGKKAFNSKCLFSGARGEVCTFEPLMQTNDLQFMGQQILIAMGTLSKVIVIVLKPRLKVLFTQQLPRAPTSLPLLTWQVVPVSGALQPVLVWGRGSELHFTRVIPSVANSGRLRLIPLRSVKLNYTLTAIHWLGSRHLALINTFEQLRLLEVRTQNELETLDLTSAGMVYTSAHFKALALGGGVSEAFALAGERACYNSFTSRGNQLVVLGTQGVQIVKLRTMMERLEYLSGQGRWAEALGLVAQDGIHRTKASDVVLMKFYSSISQNGIDKDSLTAAVNCCVKLNKIDFLCNELWEVLSTDHLILDWFYTLLTDNICNGTLYYLNPSVAQALVQHLKNKNIQVLENVLLSLDLSCMDLHQVLKICKEMKLYDAWIHITTKAIGDYVGPLKEFIDELTPDNHKLGNALLVYVSMCLSGLGYPHGVIALTEAPRIKHDILRCLETAHSLKAAANEPSYPYLRALIKYNTRECLNVIDLAFREPEFSGEMGLLQRQRLVKILLDIVVQPEFNDDQVVILACFVSRLIVSGNLNADVAVLNKVTKSLMNIASKSLSLRNHLEREQAWIELLNAGKLEHLTSKQLLEMAVESECYKVMEAIYELQGDYSNILDCYLRDKIRQSEVFSYILQHMKDERRGIPEQFSKYFLQLLRIDCKKVAEITVEYFGDEVERYCEILREDSNLLSKFLSEIVYGDVKLPAHIAEEYLKLLCSRNSSSVCRFVKLGLCRLEQALEITQRYEVHSATAILLEQNGDYKGALDCLLKNNVFDDVLGVCVRGSEHLDSKESQELWLKLLKHPTSGQKISVRDLLHVAAPHVPAAQLMELVSDASFGDVKVLLQEMLTDCRHDIQMLVTTLDLLGQDLHHGLAKSLAYHGRGIAVHKLHCYLCQKSLDKDESVAVWGCGHCFHAKCMQPLEDVKCCPHCRTPVSHGSPPGSVSTPKRREFRTDVLRLRPDLEGHF